MLFCSFDVLCQQFVHFGADSPLGISMCLDVVQGVFQESTLDSTAELHNEIEEEWPRLTQCGFRPEHHAGDVAPAQGNLATFLLCHCAMSDPRPNWNAAMTYAIDADGEDI